MSEETKEPRIKDDEYIAKWVSMLNTFKTLTKENPSVEDVKPDLEELIEMAKLSVYLTPNQKSGIVERCQNYINGTYGKSLSHTS